jgi:AcrR family transcriptional regulator
MATPAAALRRDAARNREQIVVAARALFAVRGLDVSVDEITQKAGVGMGTLYRHFATKDDLITAVLDDAFVQYVGLAEAAHGADEAWTGIVGLLEAALAMHAADRGLRELVYSHDRNRRRADAARRRLRSILAEVVVRAHREGSLRDDVTADDLLLVLAGGAGVIQRAGNDAGEAAQRFLQLVLPGLERRERANRR